MKEQRAAAGPDSIFGFCLDDDRSQAACACGDRSGQTDGARTDDRYVCNVVARIANR